MQDRCYTLTNLTLYNRLSQASRLTFYINSKTKSNKQYFCLLPHTKPDVYNLANKIAKKQDIDRIRFSQLSLFKVPMLHAMAILFYVDSEKKLSRAQHFHLTKGHENILM